VPRFCPPDRQLLRRPYEDPAALYLLRLRFLYMIDRPGLDAVLYNEGPLLAVKLAPAEGPELTRAHAGLEEDEHAGRPH
jgi:hypothetical protein